MNNIFKTLAISALTCTLFTNVAYAQLSKDEIANFNKIAKENPELIVELFSQDRDLSYEVYYQMAKNHWDLLVSVIGDVDVAIRSELLMEDWKNDIKTPKRVATEGRPSRGNDNAPVTLYAFSNFTCTYCAQGSNVVDQLMQQYPNIRYVYKTSVNLDNEYEIKSALWFLSAIALDEEKGWEFYKWLYGNQQLFFSDPDNTLIQIAKQIGLNPNDIEKDINKNEKKYMAIISEDVKDAETLGFEGTPYYLMNDIIIRGAAPVENFVDAYNFVLENNTK